MSRRLEHPSRLRAPILLVVAAVLVGGGLLDRIGGQAAPVSPPAVQPGPLAAPAGALSSSWFCAGVTDGGTLDAPGYLVIANGAGTSVTGTVHLVSSRGPSVEIPLTMAPDSVKNVAETIPGGSPWVGAMVEMDGGEVAVDQQTDAGLGYDASPCVTSGSPQWYFTSGATLVNAGVELSLLNPYPTLSVVDLSFTTNEGPEEPQGFQGLVVPADGMINVNLGDHLRRRNYIASTVTTQSGRVVAWETQWATPPQPGSVLLGTSAAKNPLADPATPFPGVNIYPGAPSLGTTWTWPDGLDQSGIGEQYAIYNPSAQTANLQLSVALDEGSAEPFDVSVGPYEVLSVISQQQARIPSGVQHSAVLRSLNGVGVVASRDVDASGGTSPWAGFGTLLGGRQSADEWIVPAVYGDRHHVAVLGIFNPGPTSVRVTIDELSNGQQITYPISSAQTVVLGPDRRSTVWLNPIPPQNVSDPLVVQSSGPVYVESNTYAVPTSGDLGLSLALGVPLGT